MEVCEACALRLKYVSKTMESLRLDYLAALSEEEARPSTRATRKIEYLFNLWGEAIEDLKMLRQGCRH